MHSSLAELCLRLAIECCLRLLADVRHNGPVEREEENKKGMNLGQMYATANHSDGLGYSSLFDNSCRNHRGSLKRGVGGLSGRAAAPTLAQDVASMTW